MIDLDDVNDCMICSNSEKEFGFDLDSWEYDELFGKELIPKSVVHRISKIELLPVLLISLNMGLLDGLGTINRRAKKVVRDRAQAWAFIQTWSDDLFYSQFRLPREEFFILCERIKHIYPGNRGTGIENYRFAQLQGSRSSPVSGPITMETKVAITLRLLAGASHLDMIWYGVQTSTVASIFLFILPLIDVAYSDLEIFNFNPEITSPTEFKSILQDMAQAWSSIMVSRKGHDLCEGTVLAGKGIVVATNAPTEDDRKGLPLSIFRNRKGCFALNAQGFCDAWCRFRYFEISWPGSTNDITAYRQTKLYSWFKSQLIDDCFHMMLDEAYGSVGGNQHLSPFTKCQLIKARAESHEKYCKMKAFNNILSSQRITIERAFGIFVRKWGILWRPLEHSLRTNALIIKVCSKLHNVCINYWMRNGKRADEIASIEQASKQRRDSGVFLEWPEEHLYGNVASPSIDSFLNDTPNDDTHHLTSERKLAITNFIYACGIEYNVQMDNDFTLNG